MPRMTEATYNADLHDARTMLLERVNAYKSAYQDQFAKHVEDTLADEWNPSPDRRAMGRARHQAPASRQVNKQGRPGVPSASIFWWGVASEALPRISDRA